MKEVIKVTILPEISCFQVHLYSELGDRLYTWGFKLPSVGTLVELAAGLIEEPVVFQGQQLFLPSDLFGFILESLKSIPSSYRKSNRLPYLAR